MDINVEMLFGHDPMLSTAYLDLDCNDNFLPMDEPVFEDLHTPAADPVGFCEDLISGESPADDLNQMLVLDYPWGQVGEYIPCQEHTMEEVRSVDDLVVEFVPEEAPKRGKGVSKCQSKVKKRTKSPDSVIFGNGKPKLYAKKPFKNPEREKARQNAINAKLNREKKKREAEELQVEMKALKDKNNQLRMSLKSLSSRAALAEKELAAIKELLVSAKVSELLKMTSECT